MWQAEDLGPAFRADVEADTPTLIVHGTWDTSTPLGNAREVVAALGNAQLIEVVGGSHGALYNLYENWPPIFDLVRAFFAGEDIAPPERVVLPPVVFDADSGER